MFISGKARHALAAMILLAGQEDWLSGPAMASQLAVSKVYLEQILALLKRSGLVRTKKGSQGGYMLKDDASSITAADILKVAEPRLFAKPLSNDKQPVYQVIDDRIILHLQTNINILLSDLTLNDLADDCTRLQNNASDMFFI